MLSRQHYLQSSFLLEQEGEMSRSTSLGHTESPVPSLLGSSTQGHMVHLAHPVMESQWMMHLNSSSLKKDFTRYFEKFGHCLLLHFFNKSRKYLIGKKQSLKFKNIFITRKNVCCMCKFIVFVSEVKIYSLRLRTVTLVT